MIRSVRNLRYYFARLRSRRQSDIPIDSRLKDLTTAQTFESQIKEHRMQFEADIPQKTLSETLKQQKPKLKQIFKVDRKDFQKKIRKTIIKELNIDRIVPGAQDQSFQSLESKSHIYDQRAQIEFQQKFRKQLFVKKETNRLISKQKNDYRNYLQEPKNEKFVEYQENLKKFKNNKIDSMMNFKRNNQQLRLLIDSGYIDNPQNITLILNKFKTTPRLEHTPENQNMHADQQFKQNNQAQKQTSMQLDNSESQSDLSEQVKQLHSKMLQNIKGPSQMRNPSMIQEFFQKLEQSNEIEKQKAQQDLNLMKKIKDFEAQSFEKRYDTLNFRFKGEVDFGWMKESQLLSYIKNQKNQGTQPKGLLTIFNQNKQKINRFNQPIITPTVMSRIYSVCSLYKYPETDENNKINMINDKKYVDLQRSLFRAIHQLSDQSFADSIYAYCKNHKEEQGALKRKMNDKIIQIMFQELKQRVGSLDQENLGLVLRSFLHTSILKRQEFNWDYIIQILSERLPSLKKQYEFESTMTFLSLVPVSQSSITAVRQNINRFREYKWQSKQTLQSFLQSCSFVIRFQNYLPQYKRSKTIQQLKIIIFNKYQEIMPITQQLSINNMPQLLSLFYYLERLRPLDAKYQIQIPSKLINKCKKQIVDNIRMQKQPIKKNTVGNLTFAMALTDYCRGLIKKDKNSQSELLVLQISTIKSLFSYRPLPFNSINYFTYHQMAKLVNSEIVNLPVKNIVQTLFANSLMRYKNQGIVEQILGKLSEKIYFQIKETGQSEKFMHNKYFKDYIFIICSFHHSRTITAYYYHFIGMIKQSSTTLFVKLEPNLMIRFFEAIVSLSFTTDSRYSQDLQIISYFSNVFWLCYQNSLKNCLNLLSKEQLIVLQYVANLFYYFKSKNIDNSNNLLLNNNLLEQIEQISQKIANLKQKLTIEEQYLRSLIKVVKKMTQVQSKQNQNQNQQKLEQFMSVELEQIQKQFYRRSIVEIMDQQQHIGSQFKYETIYENVRKNLIKSNPESVIQAKTWRIQIKDKKQVYFISTYEHLLAKYQQENTNVRLFGFWKIYSELYLERGWKFKLICTFLEG